MTIEPGKYGWFEFTPYKNQSSGYLEKYDWKGNFLGKTYVTSESPSKVNGKLDGILTAKHLKQNHNKKSVLHLN